MMPLLPFLQVTLQLSDQGAADFGASLLLGTFKFFFIVGAFLYLIFAFIVIRQVYIMRRTLITEFSPLFTTLAYVHFIGALGVLVLYWLIL